MFNLKFGKKFGRCCCCWVDGAMPRPCHHATAWAGSSIVGPCRKWIILWSHAYDLLTSCQVKTNGLDAYVTNLPNFLPKPNEREVPAKMEWHHSELTFEWIFTIPSPPPRTYRASHNLQFPHHNLFLNLFLFKVYIVLRLWRRRKRFVYTYKNRHQFINLAPYTKEFCLKYEAI